MMSLLDRLHTPAISAMVFGVAVSLQAAYNAAPTRPRVDLPFASFFIAASCRCRPHFPELLDLDTIYHRSYSEILRLSRDFLKSNRLVGTYCSRCVVSEFLLFVLVLMPFPWRRCLLRLSG